MQAPNWKNGNIELVKEALRQGELRLSAQVQLATSADQRATVLAGIYVAAATGVIAALASLDAVKQAPPLVIGGATAAICFLVGAVFCIHATLPIDFWTPGNDPQEWYGDIEQNKDVQVALGEQAEHFNTHILANRKSIDRNAARFLIGALTGISAPIVGLFVAGLTCLFLPAGLAGVFSLAGLHPG